MSKCIVIGGGFAGLSAAVHLSKNNIATHLIEASPKLGGRAHSFNYSNQNEVVDNGQHIMMGCYNYTLEFLRIIGANKNIEFQKNLNVKFVSHGGKEYQLKAPSIPYPVNLLFAMLNYKAISFPERLNAIKLVAKLLMHKNSSLAEMTVEEWLRKDGQSIGTVKALWEILAIGTLNTTCERASAETFAMVLKEIFLKGNKASTIVLPSRPLSKMYCENSAEFIFNHGGKISTSEKVVQLKTDDDKIIKVVTNKNEYTQFKHVISAVPHYALQRLIENADCRIERFDYSPILNIHIWLNDNPFHEKFYGLIDSNIHWVFNHKKFISLVTSSADDLIELNDSEIMELVYKELTNFFPRFSTKSVIDYQIIKEKRATFVPAINSELNRETITSPYKNLILAGDWTNTGLPSTIESAVKSGAIAASKINGHLVL